MRKIYYMAMALVFAIFTGCQDENELYNVQNKGGHTFYATIENGAGTRTALGENNKVLWSEGDKISVFSGTTHNSTYFLESGEGTTSGTFNSNDISFPSNSSSIATNAAYYPYDYNVKIQENNDGTYTFNATFPATQTYAESGTFGKGAAPMVAVTSGKDDENFKFKNVGAIFRLPLKGEATITKIVFSANASLAGKCNITASHADGSTSAPTVEVTEEGKTITLDCGESGVQLNTEVPTNFIVAMLPVVIEKGGITIHIYDNTGKKMVYTYKADQTITIERSKAYTTAEVTYDGVDILDQPEDAQAALDMATNGTVISLEPGVNYGTLVFRQNANSKVVDITDAGGDAAGNEHYSEYKNITILGAPGAIVDQIDFEVSWIPGSGSSYVDIKNLTVKDVTFSGEKTAINMEGSKGSALGIDGLTIENCKMNDADGNNRLVFQQISGYKELSDKTTNVYVMTTGVKNLTIKGCEVTGAYQVIESRAMENLTITNNTFKNIKERDMLITSDTQNYPNETYTGEISITGNTSIEGEERFVRASLNNSNAVVTITGNTIIDYKGKDDDYIKVEGTTNTIIENNKYIINITDFNFASYLTRLLEDPSITALKFVTSKDKVGGDNELGGDLKVYYNIEGNSTLTVYTPAHELRFYEVALMSMFFMRQNLTSIEFDKGFNTENATNMERMFSGCTNLTSLDLSNFNTSNVTNMGEMFQFCSSLTSLDLSSFNTANVTNMNNMFSDCANLTSLDLSHFNTANVTTMSYMFDCCNALNSLTFGDNFTTAKVTDMSNMFERCGNLPTLDLSSFVFTNVTYYESMFENFAEDCCSSSNKAKIYVTDEGKSFLDTKINKDNTEFIVGTPSASGN